MVIRDTETQPSHREQQRAGDVFRRPFDVAVVKKQLEEKLDVRELGVQDIYEESVTKDIKYRVFYGEGNIVFHLTDEAENILANFICAPNGNKIKFHHREVMVNLKEETGISGSDYLKKAEEFLRIFLQVVEVGMDDMSKKKYFEIEAGQAQVIEWATEKNHYHFANPEQAKLFADIKAGTSHVVTDEFAKGNLYRGYIIKSREDYDRLVALKKTITDERIFRSDVVHASERFDLIKDI